MAILILNANSVDPDQTPRSAASDLGLHCLPMSLLRDAMLRMQVLIWSVIACPCCICNRFAILSVLRAGIMSAILSQQSKLHLYLGFR